MPSGLDAAHRTADRVGTIRSAYRGVDSLGPGAAAPGAGRAAAPGAARHGQTATVDAQNRVNLGKALTALGRTSDTFLVAAREDRHFVAAGADSPLLTPVPVDAQRRLTLPPAAGLDVRRGDRVQPVAAIDTGELPCSPRPTRCRR